MIWSCYGVLDDRLYNRYTLGSNNRTNDADVIINRKHFGVSEYTFTALCEGDTLMCMYVVK